MNQLVLFWALTSIGSYMICAADVAREGFVVHSGLFFFSAVIQAFAAFRSWKP
jgi:hypothetical protein